jgi:formate dehydrogenase major subunit
LQTDSLLIHPEDADKHGIAEGDMVCVESARGKIDVKARISLEVNPGILSSTFHFPEVNMNVLTSSVTDTDALCPEYKVCAVRIRKSKGKYKLQA